MLTQAQKYYGHGADGEFTVIQGVMPEPPETFEDDDDEFDEHYQMAVFELTMGATTNG